MTTGTEASRTVRRLLAATTVPVDVVDDFLSDAPELWLSSARAELLAGDVALCHPGLRPGEVRAVARPVSDDLLRLTILAEDRPRLLADTAGVVSTSGFSILAASAITCWRRGVGLHALTVAADPADGGDGDWDLLGSRLRAIGGRGPAPVGFSPLGTAEVETDPLPDGHTLVTVRARDQVGLLWAICSWFADHGLSIETAQVSGEGGGWVTDRFVVGGALDAASLSSRLSS